MAIALSESPLIGRKLLIKDGPQIYTLVPLLKSNSFIGESFEGRPAAIPGAVTFNDPTIARQTHSKTAQKILRLQKQSPAPTLFFGNLGFETTETSIRELLDAHRFIKKLGKDAQTEVVVGDKYKDVWIRKVRMGTFEDSGLCKGYLNSTFFDPVF